MRIAIIGCGAIGSFLGVLLTRSNHKGKWQGEVVLIDHNRQRTKIIEKRGIRVTGRGKEWSGRVKIKVASGRLKAADLIIICVKAYDTISALKIAKLLLIPESNVLSLQNGLGNLETIAAVTGQGRVIGGVTALGVTYLAPGRIRYAGSGETIIGRLAGGVDKRLKEIQHIFNVSGISTFLTSEIEVHIWRKLLANVGINAITAIAEMKNGKILEFPPGREILSLAVNEAVSVARARKIRLLDVDPVGYVESVCRKTAKNMSSMLQDVQRKKKTEVDFINGAIVREADRLGITAPVNLTLTRLVHLLEQKR